MMVDKQAQIWYNIKYEFKCCIYRERDCNNGVHILKIK